MIVTNTDLKQAVGNWPKAPYRVRLAQVGELEQPLAPTVLRAVVYGTAPSYVQPDVRRVYVPLRSVHQNYAGEIWESTLPVRYGRDGLIEFAENGEVIFLQASLPESDLKDTAGAAERLYKALWRYSALRHYGNFLRVWNYLPGINVGDGDAERYRNFCVGRHRALSADPSFERKLPAATAIGTNAGRFVVMAIASIRPGQQVENPLQVSAFRYPRAYGARSPSFARAQMLPWADGTQLLVSGTASIVGHASTHLGDASAQLHQSLANVNALVRQPGLARRGFLPQSYTLYLRDPEDYTSLYPQLMKYFNGTPLQVLVGDICRRELLLEVEAIYQLPQFLNK